MTPFEWRKLQFLKHKHPHIRSAEDALEAAIRAGSAALTFRLGDPARVLFAKEQAKLEELAHLLEKDEIFWKKMKKNTPVLGEHTLPNGRIYKITDTGQPYIPGEYASGGLLIEAKRRDDTWSYIDNSPDEECVRRFLQLAESLPPVWL